MPFFSFFFSICYKAFSNIGSIRIARRGRDTRLTRSAIDDRQHMANGARGRYCIEHPPQQKNRRDGVRDVGPNTRGYLFRKCRACVRMRAFVRYVPLKLTKLKAYEGPRIASGTETPTSSCSEPP